MVQELITSFLASFSFGIIFNAPKNSLIQCGFAGMTGWFIYILLSMQGFDSVPATLVAATVVGMISQFFARIYKMPVIIVNVAGIIPLVPGALAYEAMRNFVINDYNTGLALGTKAFLISGAIAFGLVFSEVFNQLIRKLLKQPKTETHSRL